MRVSNLSVPIHYSQVRCSGEQESLMDCSLSEITSECSHDQDAAIEVQYQRAFKNFSSPYFEFQTIIYQYRW